MWEWGNTDPFGNNVPNENPSGLGQFVFDLRFTGMVADKETGLFQNFHRDYDPATGTYKEFDPIGLRGGINGYVYALQNPLRYTDPTGLFVVPAARATFKCLIDPKCAAAAAAAYAAAKMMCSAAADKVRDWMSQDEDDGANGEDEVVEKYPLKNRERRNKERREKPKNPEEKEQRQRENEKNKEASGRGGRDPAPTGDDW